MKKLIILIFIFFITGCDLVYLSPSSTVKNYLDKYKLNDDVIVEELNEYLESEEFDDNILEEYREVYLRQYTNLKYEIKDEIITKNKATINVLINVFDYYTCNKESSEYFINNQDKFLNEDGDINLDKYLNYKLNNMLNTENRINYLIDLTLTKNNNLWEIDPISSDTYEKLHGTFNIT